jgi:hypothetical protein
MAILDTERAKLTALDFRDKVKVSEARVFSARLRDAV